MDSEHDQPAEMSISEAAARFGVSEKTVRRRIKAGELPAIQKPTSQGFEWRIVLNGEVPVAQLPHRPDQVDSGNVVQFPRHADQLPTQPEARHNDALLEALRIVDRLQRENLELAGRVGYFQAKNQALEERVLLLQAPRRPAGEPLALPRQEIPVEPVPALAGASAAQETRLPWWKRLFAVE